ncbi:ATP synthase F(1) complex subunit epsilon, mitochondrial-like [Branchiostoma floridae x Branchiostoma japonicum]
MVAYWRQAGMSYLQYSGICARLLRRVLKPELQDSAMKREAQHLSKLKWEAGKPLKEAQ